INTHFIHSTMNTKIILLCLVAVLFCSEASAQYLGYSGVYSQYYGYPSYGYGWGYPGYAAWWGSNKGGKGPEGVVVPSGLIGRFLSNLPALWTQGSKEKNQEAALQEHATPFEVFKDLDGDETPEQRLERQKNALLTMISVRELKAILAELEGRCPLKYVK
ncbi:hypothetical protein PFISCL1PPCAC_10666, partial [Pristionchus fissidentatus]